MSLRTSVIEDPGRYSPAAEHEALVQNPSDAEKPQLMRNPLAGFPTRYEKEQIFNLAFFV